MQKAHSFGPHGHDYSELSAAVTRHPDDVYVFIPNFGNAGDSLLNLGAYEFLRAHDVRYEVGSNLGTYPGRRIIFSGGGNLVAPYPNARDFFHANLEQAKELILMPHTVRSYPDLLESLDARFTLFAREQKTYAYLQAHAPGARIHLGHDMAFYLTRQMVERPKLGMIAPNLQTMRRRLLREWRLMTMARAKGKMADGLNAYRTDVEKTDIPLPAPNFDLSNLFAADDMSYPSCQKSAWAMVRAISPHRAVHTNRLHVGILSALLGKSTHLRDNSYGKLGDVYRQSMADVFTCVEWMG